MPSKTCSTRWRRAGLTLIEVVAAIAILGTILVGVVLAKSRHTHQIALTQRRAAAVRATDELLRRWWTRKEGVPVGDSGTFGPSNNLRWETRVKEKPALRKLGARVVRVEVREVDPPEHRADAGGEPLLAVELVLPEPEEESNERGDAGGDGGREVVRE